MLMSGGIVAESPANPVGGCKPQQRLAGLQPCLLDAVRQGIARTTVFYCIMLNAKTHKLFNQSTKEFLLSSQKYFTI
jgi:hypothetical protein